jgi:hypothetical protein
MFRRVGLVRTDVSEESVASIFRVEEITQARKCQTVANVSLRAGFRQVACMTKFHNQFSSSWSPPKILQEYGELAGQNESTRRLPVRVAVCPQRITREFPSWVVWESRD